MKKVTAWASWNKKENQYEHNHIENDWVEGDYPKPKKPEFILQKSWKGKIWKKEFCYLTSSNKVVKNVKEIT